MAGHMATVRCFGDQELRLGTSKGGKFPSASPSAPSPGLDSSIAHMKRSRGGHWHSRTHRGSLGLAGRVMHLGISKGKKSAPQPTAARPVKLRACPAICNSQQDKPVRNPNERSPIWHSLTQRKQSRDAVSCAQFLGLQRVCDASVRPLGLPWQEFSSGM